MPDIERTWLPSDYMDESIPPPRPSPKDWIELTDDGLFCLGSSDPFDDDAKGAILKDGDRVKFDWTEYHGRATLTFKEDGSYDVSPPMPADPPDA